MRSAGHTLRSSSAVFPAFRRVFITLELGGTGVDPCKLFFIDCGGGRPQSEEERRLFGATAAQQWASRDVGAGMSPARRLAERSSLQRRAPTGSSGDNMADAAGVGDGGNVAARVPGGEQGGAVLALAGDGAGAPASDDDVVTAALEALAALPPGSDRDENDGQRASWSEVGDDAVSGLDGGSADGGTGASIGARGSSSGSGTPRFCRFAVDASSRLPESLAAIIRSASWLGMEANAGSGNFLAGLPTQPITDAMTRRFFSETGLPSIASLSCARMQAITQEVRSVEKRISKVTGRSRDWRGLCPPELWNFNWTVKGVVLASRNGIFPNTHPVVNDIFVRRQALLVAFNVDLLWNTAVGKQFADDPHVERSTKRRPRADPRTLERSGRARRRRRGTESNTLPRPIAPRRTPSPAACTPPSLSGSGRPHSTFPPAAARPPSPPSFVAALRRPPPPRTPPLTPPPSPPPAPPAGASPRALNAATASPPASPAAPSARPRPPLTSSTGGIVAPPPPALTPGALQSSPVGVAGAAFGTPTGPPATAKRAPGVPSPFFAASEASKAAMAAMRRADGREPGPSRMGGHGTGISGGPLARGGSVPPAAPDAPAASGAPAARVFSGAAAASNRSAGGPSTPGGRSRAGASAPGGGGLASATGDIRVATASVLGRRGAEAAGPPTLPHVTKRARPAGAGGLDPSLSGASKPGERLRPLHLSSLVAHGRVLTVSRLLKNWVSIPEVHVPASDMYARAVTIKDWTLVQKEQAEVGVLFSAAALRNALRKAWALEPVVDLDGPPPDPGRVMASLPTSAARLAPPFRLTLATMELMRVVIACNSDKELAVQSRVWLSTFDNDTFLTPVEIHPFLSPVSLRFHDLSRSVRARVGPRRPEDVVWERSVPEASSDGRPSPSVRRLDARAVMHVSRPEWLLCQFLDAVLAELSCYSQENNCSSYIMPCDNFKMMMSSPSGETARVVDARKFASKWAHEAGSSRSFVTLVNLSNSHWCAAHLCFDTRVVKFANSGSDTYDDIPLALRRLVMLGECVVSSRRGPSDAVDKKPWSVKSICPVMQRDGYNCGVFALRFVIGVVTGTELPFSLGGDLLRLVMINRVVSSSGAVSVTQPAVANVPSLASTPMQASPAGSAAVGAAVATPMSAEAAAASGATEDGRAVAASPKALAGEPPAALRPAVAAATRAVTGQGRSHSGERRQWRSHPRRRHGRPHAGERWRCPSLPRQKPRRSHSAGAVAVATAGARAGAG